MGEQPKRFLRWEGDVVTAGGAYFCRAARELEPGRRCGGRLGGSPPVGAVLDLVMAPGTYFDDCRPGVLSIECRRCALVYVFSLPIAA
jgi:hypothetical protein